ncbi:peptidase inhibitor family I36 protein [Streptomyces sp. NBC_01142]|uniref:peptidase inhibitor family I36 protein n=1 Tax=Streptomyces sp. NBC_01142 TaxID=2975865 RepID=UPI0022527634|nr:peptidase inhibitor family I36 protein [Streptomyces sp. NBC_01142]MCX4822849.1 peptidase inhibitor family I36 protein [Streptomyces sp. NBC_01142]
MRKTVTATVLAAAALMPQLLQLPHLPRAAAAVAAPGLGQCATGELCLWEKGDFRGTRRTHELAGLDIESCVPLPPGTSAQALANRTGRPVTTYQSEECAETGEFETYPGGGTWVPQSPYRVRAFKVWES